MPLTTFEIAHAKPGMHADGGGLYLQVSRGGTKSWIFRYQLGGRRREMGLGSVGALSPNKARAQAEELKVLTRKGVDPLDEKERAAALRASELAVRAQQEALAQATVRQVSLEYMRAHGAAWKNPKHAQQWANTLKTYVYPSVGDLPIAELSTQHVLDILKPIWVSKAETASRVRSRLELVVTYAKARGWFRGENPAVWRGHLAALLPATSKVRRVRHHPALPWSDIAPFMKRLSQMPGTGARALEFTILTAARSGEVRGARWREFDLDRKLWIVPAERMKARREHRVPLSTAVVALLGKLPKVDDEDGTGLVFPGAKAGRPLSDMTLSAVLRRLKETTITVHGFRSTFRDWAAELTFHHPDLVELALAHMIQNKVEAAYRRGDLLEKRRELMEDWARWCAGEPGRGEAL